MEAAHSHGVKNTTLILLYSQEPLFPFALTYDMLLHNMPKCKKSRNIILKQLMPTLYFPPKS